MTGAKWKLARFVLLSTAVLIVVGLGVGLALGEARAAEETAGPAAKTVPHPHASFIAMAAAISIAGGLLGAGYAVAHVGAAAIGAASERPEIMGRALLFVAMGEGLAVLGLVGGVLLMAKLTL